MSRQGSLSIGTSLRAIVIAAALILGAALDTPAALLTACATILGVICYRPRVPSPEVAPQSPSPLHQIELEALRDRVGALEEALDDARNDILVLADVAEAVPSDQAGIAISRLARITGLLQQDPEECRLGDVLVEQLTGLPPGTFVIESELPRVCAPPLLVEELIRGMVEASATAVGPVHGRGGIEGGMAIMELEFLAGSDPRQAIGYHVAERAAAVLGGRVSLQRHGGVDQILAVIPMQHFPAVRIPDQPMWNLGLI